MALVRKLQGGGKKVAYENVGEYDADNLARTLTLELEHGADIFNLKGLDKADFIKYGATMIQAIKDGNVSKNADGSFSILGDYDLNNHYTDTDIKLKKDDKEVGYGADVYEGSHQKSHGIFTTNKTRNFRDRNHILGLVGRWASDIMKGIPTIAKEEEKPTTKYNFDLAFIDAKLGGDVKLFPEWIKNNKKDERIAQVATIFDSIDYDKWSETFDGKYTAETLKAAANPIKEALLLGDTTTASNIANSLGFSLNSFIQDDATDQSKKQDPTREEQWQALAKLTVGEGYSQNVYDAWIKLEWLKKVKDGQTILDDLYSNQMLKAFDQLTSQTIPESYRNNGIQEIHDFKMNDGETMADLGDQLNILMQALDEGNLPETGFNSMQNAEPLIDAYIDQYETMDPELIADTYLEITEGDYAKWIVILPSVTDKASTIFNPITGEFRRVLNNYLPGTEGYNVTFGKFKSQYEREHAKPIAAFNKEGGIIKALTGWLAHATNIRKNQTAVLKAHEESKKAAETAVLTLTNEESAVAKGIQENAQIRSIEDWRPEVEWARVGASIGDLFALGMSMTGAGSVASATTGFVASTIPNTVADWNDDSIGKGEFLKRLGTNVGFDALSLIPWARMTKAAKITKSLDWAIPSIIAGISVYLGIENKDAYVQSWKNIASGNFNANDIQNAASSINILIGGAASANTARKARKNASTIVEDGKSIKGADGKDYKISDEAAITEIKNTPEYKKANEAFRAAVASEQGLDDVAKLPASVKLPTTVEVNLWSGWGKGKHVIDLEAPKVKVLTRYKLPESTIQTNSRGRSRVVTPGQTDIDFVASGKLPGVAAIGRALDASKNGIVRGTVTAADYARGYRGSRVNPEGMSSEDFLKARRHEKELTEAVHRGNQKRTREANNKATQEADAKALAQRAENEAKVAKLYKENLRKALREKVIERLKQREKVAKEMGPKLEELVTNLQNIEIARRSIEAGRKWEAYRNPLPSVVDLLKASAQKATAAIREAVSKRTKPTPVAPVIEVPHKPVEITKEHLKEAKQMLRRQGKPHTDADARAAILAGKLQQGGTVEFAKTVLANRNNTSKEDLKTLFYKVGGKVIYARDGWKVGDKVFSNINAARYYQKANNIASSVDPITDYSGEFEDADAANPLYNYSLLGSDNKNVYSITNYLNNAKNSENTLNNNLHSNPSSYSRHIWNGLYTADGNKNMRTNDIQTAYGNYGGDTAQDFVNRYNSNMDIIRAMQGSNRLYGTRGNVTLTINDLPVNVSVEDYNRMYSKMFSSLGTADNGKSSADWGINYDNRQEGIYGQSTFARIGDYYDNDDDIGENRTHEITLGDGTKAIVYKLANGNLALKKPDKTPAVQVTDILDNIPIPDIDESELDNDNIRVVNGVTLVKDKNGNWVPKTGKLDPADLPKPKEGDTGINWGNISEFGRMLYRNRANLRIADRAKNYMIAPGIPERGYEIHEGNYYALKEAEQGAARLNSIAGRTFTSDADRQLAGQLTGTVQGNAARMQAALADSLRFYETRHKVADMLRYYDHLNTEEQRKFLARLAEKSEKDAMLDANAMLLNSENLSNLWAAYNKQWFDQNDMLRQLGISYNAKRTAAAQQATLTELNRKIAALDPTLKESYEREVARLTKEYQDALDAANAEEVKRSKRLVAPGIFNTYTLLAKGGSKLTASLKYILESSKDFNKRKLSDAKEFNKNIRESNKRRRKWLV